jgi:DNA-binding transcriptional regulator YiaG
MTTTQIHPPGQPGRESALAELESVAQATYSLPSPVERREIRKRAGLSLDQLAKAVGVSRACLSKWERGKRYPSPAYRVQYARALAIAEKYAE